MSYNHDMNRITAPPKPAAGYDEDFAAWSSDQARRLRALQPAEIDWENVAEEIESLGRSDKRAIGSDLKVVLEHLLKWRYQANKRTPSWSRSIDEHRERIADLIGESPSLAPLPREVLAEQYARARRTALKETGLSAKQLPESCPFTVEQVLDPDYWPED